ncbi:TPR-like protein [Rozella allomycis CSF55]|uniref:TPR-like protein n=1 Tax=Rozella allomycis (strain CSF55) TaxID=988480 RepID=A0A4P9YQ38_ROZAC|nr:TPR-like protein [Rozella allomycis CSF55]
MFKSKPPIQTKTKGSSSLDSDLFNGFDDIRPNTAYFDYSQENIATAGQKFRNPVKSSYLLASSYSRAGSVTRKADYRPVTSRKGAGFTSKGRPKTSIKTNQFDPLNQAFADAEITTEDKFRQLEINISVLINQSVLKHENGDGLGALAKAKDAAKKDLLLSKQRTQEGQQEMQNLDLSFVAILNLATQYENCKMFQEALNSYSILVKNKIFNQAGRFRVNMGNIYFVQKKFNQAIKMYRMALDQIPTSFKEIRMKILKNIGLAFVEVGKYHDAITSFENVLDTSGDYQAAFNLILCYYALGDKENMKKCFHRFAFIQPINQIDQYTDLEASHESEEFNDSLSGNKIDSLRKLYIERKKQLERYVVLTAKLISNVIEENFETGYDWIIDVIRSSPLIEFAGELDISKAMQYLKCEEYDKAIECLKNYEKRDQKLISTAATNISFLYFLESEYKLAQKYAQTALDNDKYNAKALNNVANCFLIKGNYDEALDLYSEAQSVDATCAECIFNTGLTYKRMQNYDEACFYFEKLHSMAKNNADVLCQLADCHEKCGNIEQSIEYLNMLTSIVPTDPKVLERLGYLHNQITDRSQALHYYSESFRFFPSSLDVINWLGTYHIESEIYEQALSYYQKAAILQPYEIKWQLIICSCYRRSGNPKAALEGYKAIHERFPYNADCLKFLMKMCEDMGLHSEVAEYSLKLDKLSLKQEYPTRSISKTSSGSSKIDSFPSSANGRRSASRNSNKSIEKDVTKRSIAVKDQLENEDINNILPE